MKVCANKWP